MPRNDHRCYKSLHWSEHYQSTMLPICLDSRQWTPVTVTSQLSWLNFSNSVLKFARSSKCLTSWHSCGRKCWSRERRRRSVCHVMLQSFQFHRYLLLHQVFGQCCDSQWPFSSVEKIHWSVIMPVNYSLQAWDNSNNNNNNNNNNNDRLTAFDPGQPG